LAQKYDIAFNIAHTFINDLMQVPYLPVVDTLLSHFKSDMSKYEVKLALLSKLSPFMLKYQAVKFMKIFEFVLNQEAEKSLFIANINPLRTGLIMFKIIDDF
jgi:hypothetical protein